MKIQTLKIHPSDNVLVVIEDLEKDTVIKTNDLEIKTTEKIPAGHKLAERHIAKGDLIIKYGNPIGNATQDIAPGQWVHTHNLKTGLSGIVEYSYTPVKVELKKQMPKEFMGFWRGKLGAGIRNDVWIIPTVGCVNGVAKLLEKEGKKRLKGSVSDVISFPHPYGCSQVGLDQEYTLKILAGLVNHPNAGAVLVLGLGCENSNIDLLKKYIGEYDSQRVGFLVCQENYDEIADGTKLLDELIDYAANFQREAISADHLIIGLKCGGSDGFSGITANPTVGRFSDLLISQGGTAILTEVPEMFGAEQILMNRACNEEIYNKTVDLINNFKIYFEQQGVAIYENPSPGNKQGGITTLEDKSLGCTQKSGDAQISGVLEYGEKVQVKGLNLLCSPGNDLVAATALSAAGAQIVLFTTGRGTPFACPVPTVKISSNSQLASKKSNWIDFDCGSAVESDTVDELAQRLMDYVLEVASGRQVKSEITGYHEISIFKIGVTL